MIKSVLFAAAIAFTPTATYARTAESLLLSCQALDRAVQNSDMSLSFEASGMTCFNYIEAMQDSLVLADVPGRPLLRACPPPKQRLTDLVHTFTGYARTHAAYLQDSAAMFMLHAFRDAYPCP